MNITLDSNPSDAPCCIKMIADDGREQLIQVDYDFPSIADAFGWNIREVKAEKRYATFNRFELEIPQECVDDCSHQGECDADVAYWAGKLDRPESITPDKLKAELKEYGAWDDEQLNNDADNWLRLIWCAACNLKEEKCDHSHTDGTIDCPDCGLKAMDFINSARQWLDDNDGAQAEDPGYFDN